MIVIKGVLKDHVYVLIMGWNVQILASLSVVKTWKLMKTMWQIFASRVMTKTMKMMMTAITMTTSNDISLIYCLFVLKGKATFLKFFWFLVRIEKLCKLWIVLFKFFKKLFSFSRYEALKYTNIHSKNNPTWVFLKEKSWRQKVLENVRRQLHVGKTVINKQYVSSIINYKILLKL